MSAPVCIVFMLCMHLPDYSKVTKEVNQRDFIHTHRFFSFFNFPFLDVYPQMIFFPFLFLNNMSTHHTARRTAAPRMLGHLSPTGPWSLQHTATSTILCYTHPLQQQSVTCTHFHNPLLHTSTSTTVCFTNPLQQQSATHSHFHNPLLHTSTSTTVCYTQPL